MANFVFVSTKQTKLTGYINKRQEEKPWQSTRQGTKGLGAQSRRQNLKPTPSLVQLYEYGHALKNKQGPDLLESRTILKRLRSLGKPTNTTPGISPLCPLRFTWQRTLSSHPDTVSHATYLYRVEQEAGVIAQFFKSAYAYQMRTVFQRPLKTEPHSLRIQQLLVKFKL